MGGGVRVGKGGVEGKHPQVDGWVERKPLFYKQGRVGSDHLGAPCFPQTPLMTLPLPHTHPPPLTLSLFSLLFFCLFFYFSCPPPPFLPDMKAATEVFLVFFAIIRPLGSAVRHHSRCYCFANVVPVIAVRLQIKRKKKSKGNAKRDASSPHACVYRVCEWH